MALDEYLFGKITRYIKNLRTNKHAIPSVVNLEDVKDKLLLIARAISGAPISIYPAKEEGDIEVLVSFYLRRLPFLMIGRVTLNFISIEPSIYVFKENWGFSMIQMRNTAKITPGETHITIALGSWMTCTKKFLV